MDNLAIRVMESHRNRPHYAGNNSFYRRVGAFVVLDHMNTPGPQDTTHTSRLAAFVDAHGRALVLIFLSLTLAGLVFSFRLPIAIFPQTDFPRIIIMVNNGIAPVDVQMLTVTRPIEESIRIVPGITNVRSVTSRGLSEISVYFRWDVDILHALHLVQGRIAQLMPNMPSEARFYVNRLTFSVFPMIGFSITSLARTTAELWDLAYYNLVPRLYRLPGVSETRIVGGRPPEYHVLVNPDKLNGYGLPLTRVVEGIRKYRRYSRRAEGAGRFRFTAQVGLHRPPAS